MYNITMEFRPILRNKGRLRVLIDSESIIALKENSKALVIKLLAYYDSPPFAYLRTPLGTDYEGLKRITAFTKKYLGKELIAADIVNEKKMIGISILNSKQRHESLGWSLYRKRNLDKNESDTIDLILIQASFNGREDLGLLVTANELLLKKRYWLEKNIPGEILNVASVNEAIEIMDIFAKHRGNYYIAGNYTANKGLWYWYKFRLCIPFYHVGDSILDAFATRFVFAFMSIDEMAFQYYSEATSDAFESTIYHFNYFITLISGIFDSLAIRTFNQYQLKFEGMNNPSKISLNKKSGKEFLKALRRENLTLRNLISKFSNFIKLIYQFRELVIHREGFEAMGFTSQKEKLHFIKINSDVKKMIDEVGDLKMEEEPLSEWGICEREGFLFLDPYAFSRHAMKFLIEFSQGYLQLLGFSNFIEDVRKNNQNDDFVKTTDLFMKFHLGN